MERATAYSGCTAVHSHCVYYQAFLIYVCECFVVFLLLTETIAVRVSEWYSESKKCASRKMCDTKVLFLRRYSEISIRHLLISSCTPISRACASFLRNFVIFVEKEVCEHYKALNVRAATKSLIKINQICTKTNVQIGILFCHWKQIHFECIKSSDSSVSSK